MTIPNYRATLAATPNLLELWDFLEQFRKQFPGLMVLAQDPFLISPYGVPSRLATGQIIFTVVPDQQGKWKSLWDELFLIERLIRQGTLSSEDYELIDTWAPGLYETIENETSGIDQYYARYLAHVSLKN